MARSRFGAFSFGVLFLVLVATLPTTFARPAPPAKDRPEFNAVLAGKMQLADISIEAVAVIDETNVVVVGTTFNKDGDANPNTLDPNGAFVNLAKKTSQPFTNGHKAGIFSVAVSRGRVTTGSIRADPVLRVWDLKAGKSYAEILLEKPDQDSPHRYGVAAFHKDDRLAVSFHERVIILDPASPGELTELTLPADSKTWLEDRLVVSDDDTMLACDAGRCEIMAWDVATGKATTTLSLVPPKVKEPKEWHTWGVHFGPKGSLIAWRSGSESEVPKDVAEADAPADRRGVVQIDLPKGKVVPLGMGQSGCTMCCAIDPTGTWLATVGSARPDKPRTDGRDSFGELRGTGPTNHVGGNVWNSPCGNGYDLLIAVDQQARRVLLDEGLPSRRRCE